MKYPLLIAALLAALFLTSHDGSVQADEPPGSLLESLNREAAEIVAQADATQVTVRRGQHWYRAVLVGTPPRVVSPYLGDRTGPSIFVRLADGREYGSSIVDGDEELGISVCAVPEAWAAKLPGLVLAPDARIRRGALGVLAGDAPSLTLINRVDAPRGRFLADVREDAAALLGPLGQLLGLRAVMGPKQSCSACHTTPVTETVAWQPLGSSLKPLVIKFAWPHGSKINLNEADPWLLKPLWVEGQIKHYITSGEKPEPGLVELGYSQDGGIRAPHGTWAQPRNPAAHAKDYLSASVIRRVLEDIDAHGKIQRGYLGVVPGPADAKQKGVRISSVLAGSPAAAAGIQAGDVVTGLDQGTCESAAAFTVALAHKRPGDRVEIARAGKDAVVVTFADRASAMQALLTAELLGLRVRALDGSLREWLSVPSETQGVLVVDATGSAVKAAGIQRGDVIVSIGGTPIRDVAELDAALATAKDGVRVDVHRGTGITSLRIPTLPKPSGRSSAR